jgi:hypothetical protein
LCLGLARFLPACAPGTLFAIYIAIDMPGYIGRGFYSEIVMVCGQVSCQDCG